MSPQLKSPRTNDLRMAVQRRWRLAAVVMTAVLAAALSLSQVGGVTTAAAPSAAKLASATTAAQSTAAAKTAAATSSAAATTATPTTTAATSSIKVMIQNYAFSPSTLNVKVGDTVTWTNMDTAPHTVTVSSGPVKFASPNLQKGDTFSYTFKTPGTYSYYCAVHPDMKGTVVVTGSGTTTPPGHPMDPPPSSGTCEGLLSVENTLLQHIYAGHLEESPGQQVQDILAIDQYVKTHTVLAENLVKPLVGSVNGTLDALLQHVYAGHLEESPGQQVQDILNINQYVNTHTVLVENLIKPLIGTDLSAC